MLLLKNLKKKRLSTKTCKKTKKTKITQSQMMKTQITPVPKKKRMTSWTRLKRKRR